MKPSCNSAYLDHRLSNNSNAPSVATVKDNVTNTKIQNCGETTRCPLSAAVDTRLELKMVL